MLRRSVLVAHVAGRSCAHRREAGPLLLRAAPTRPARQRLGGGGRLGRASLAASGPPCRRTVRRTGHQPRGRDRPRQMWRGAGGQNVEPWGGGGGGGAVYSGGAGAAGG